MTVAELKAKLVWARFAPSTYSLDGATPQTASDAFILTKQRDGWLIESIERGVRQEQGLFYTEDDACNEFYRLMNQWMRD